MVSLNGCIYLGRNVYFESRRPVFPVPERPQLQQVPPPKALIAEDGTVADSAALAEAYRKAVANLAKVMTREQQLEAMIKKWNEHAVSANQENGYDPLP